MGIDRRTHRATIPRRVVVRLILVLTFACSGLAIGAGTASAASQMFANETLYSGNGLVNYAYHLEMQSDGNLVLYWGSTAIWSPYTNTPGSRLVMQGDGNLVVYRPNNSPAWASGTAGSGATRVILAANGELYMTNSNNAVVWQLGTRAFGLLSGYRPPDANLTWATSLPSQWTYPAIWAMSTLNWADMNTTQVSNFTTARVWMKENPGLSNSFGAYTYCMSSSNGFCVKYNLDINPNVNHSDLEAVICHEAGHTAGLAHDDSSPLYRNSLYISAEQSCLRGNPDVHQYGVRRTALINSLV